MPLPKSWPGRLGVALLAFVLLAFLLRGAINAVAGLPDIGDRPAATRAGSGSDTRLGEAIDSVRARQPGQVGIIGLPFGLDAFAARVALARLAERIIDTQYYMWHQDPVGRFLVYELIDAADRGVKVRLLVDDMYGDEGEATWLAMDAHPNIEVRLFAPFSRKQPKLLQFVTRFSAVNARMHTKTFTVDGQATIVGGRNIGSEYFDADPDLAFADNDVLAVGPVVDTVSDNFVDYWNSDFAYRVSVLSPPAGIADLDALRRSAPEFREQPEVQTYLRAVAESTFASSLVNQTASFTWGSGVVVHDAWWKRDSKRPGWRDALLITDLLPYLSAAREELLIVSPYFVPDDEITQELCRLASDGVAVRILTNSLASNDVVAVHAGYVKVRKPLLRCGVELYELNERLTAKERKSLAWLPRLDKSSLHAKSMVIDRETMFVGSFNLDERSLYLNTEIGLVFDVPAIADEAARAFDANIEAVAFRVAFADDGRALRWTGIEDGQVVTLHREPYVGVGTRAAVAILRWLPLDWAL